ncbi:MAG TPA: hypothetical protein VE843_03480, partial [Ktedonobacteraceae bacterium]|nr:hypothetical protein [Ktedonobacteraceae bacterium]
GGARKGGPLWSPEELGQGHISQPVTLDKQKDTPSLHLSTSYIIVNLSAYFCHPERQRRISANHESP